MAAQLLTGVEESLRCGWRALLARLYLAQQLVLAYGVHPHSALAPDTLCRWCSLLLQHRSLYVRSAAVALVWTLHGIDPDAVRPFLKVLQYSDSKPLSKLWVFRYH